MIMRLMSDQNSYPAQISLKMILKQTSLSWENPQGGTFVNLSVGVNGFCVCV